MGKRYKNLFDKIVDMDNLWDAYRKTSRGKRSTRSYLEFAQNEAYNLKEIQKDLITGSYKVGKPKQFLIYDPKKRLITALPFRDRVVQHAINNIINPIFDKTFLPRSYACRAGKGNYKAIEDLQASMRSMNAKGRVWFLKTDFAGYFYSIRIVILLRLFRNKISCNKTFMLIRLFFKSAVGMCVGNLLSQLAANIYGNVVDRSLLKIGVKTFFRYADDMIVLGKSQTAMHKIMNWLQKKVMRVLGLSFSKWRVGHSLVNFCGFRIHPKYKLLCKQNVKRAKRVIKSSSPSKHKFLQSWMAHTQRANVHNLFNALELT